MLFFFFRLVLLFSVLKLARRPGNDKNLDGLTVAFSLKLIKRQVLWMFRENIQKFFSKLLFLKFFPLELSSEKTPPLLKLTFSEADMRSQLWLLESRALGCLASKFPFSSLHHPVRPSLFNWTLAPKITPHFLGYNHYKCKNSRPEYYDIRTSSID